MDFWHKKYPNEIYNLDYEFLTTNQREETNKLLKYVGLDWEESCFNFHTNRRAINTASSMQVRQKLYQGSSKGWRKYEAYIGEMMPAFNKFDVD